MRKSNTYNCLILISDHTKETPYIDKWYGDILYYTGMGKIGDQSLSAPGNYQNRTLYDSNKNGVELHLFEVKKPKEYTYKGVVKLVAEPYQEKQLDENKKIRKVWIFPIKPLT